MSEKFPVETAKKPDDLEAIYKKVKASSKEYGFSTIAELKVDVVKKAMTESKKPAEFVVEVDAAKTMIVQMFCEVKGKMRSVIGRSEIKTMDDYKKATALASNGNLKKVAGQMFV